MTETTETGVTPEKLPDDMRRRLHAAVCWHVSLRSWEHAKHGMPTTLTVKERHRLEAAHQEVLGLFKQVEAVEVDVTVVQRMLDAVEKVPWHAFCDGNVAYFALYNSMTFAEHLHDDVVLGPRLADLSGRRCDFVTATAARYDALIEAARAAARKAAA